MKETLSTFFTTYSSDKKYLAIAKLTSVLQKMKKWYAFKCRRHVMG